MRTQERYPSKYEELHPAVTSNPGDFTLVDFTAIILHGREVSGAAETAGCCLGVAAVGGNYNSQQPPSGHMKACVACMKTGADVTCCAMYVRKCLSRWHMNPYPTQAGSRHTRTTSQQLSTEFIIMQVQYNCKRVTQEIQQTTATLILQIRCWP